MRYGLLIGAMISVLPTAGHAKESVEGVYLCTTIERAGLRSDHREGSGDPSAFVDDELPTRFKMHITPTGKVAKEYRLVEVAYDGTDRDKYTWQDENSVLHGTYIGDGDEFRAVDSPAFLSFYRTLPGHGDGNLAFYHAGFELPGGEDTQLAVRWGRCRKVE